MKPFVKNTLFLLGLLLSSQPSWAAWTAGANAISRSFSDSTRSQYLLQFPNGPMKWTETVTGYGPVDLMTLDMTGGYDAGYDVNAALNFGEGVWDQAGSAPQLMTRTDLVFNAAAWVQYQAPGLTLNSWFISGPLTVDVVQAFNLVNGTNIPSAFDFRIAAPSVDFTLPFLGDGAPLASIPLSPVGIYKLDSGGLPDHTMAISVDINRIAALRQYVSGQIGAAVGLKGKIDLGLAGIDYHSGSSLIGTQSMAATGVDVSQYAGGTVNVTRRDYRFAVRPEVTAGVSPFVRLNLLGFSLIQPYEKYFDSAASAPALLDATLAAQKDLPVPISSFTGNYAVPPTVVAGVQPATTQPVSPSNGPALPDAQSLIGAGLAQAGDTVKPTVTITSPTSAPTYTAQPDSHGRIVLGGTALDNVGVTSVMWSNSRGGGGSAEVAGDTWSAPSILLASGTNVLTVRAFDAAGNSGTTQLTVSYGSGIAQGQLVATYGGGQGGGPITFGVLDPATGAFTVKGTFGSGSDSTVFAQVSGNTLYVQGAYFGLFPYTLYTLDISTGQLLSSVGTGTKVIAGVSSSGQLIATYGGGQGGGPITFGVLDPATGAFTVKGTFGSGSDSAVFTQVSGNTLYVHGAYFGLSPYTLYTLDISTGQLLSSVDPGTKIIAGVSSTISFGPAPSLAVNGIGIVSATATSGLAVNLISTTPDTCAVMDNPAGGAAGSTANGITEGVVKGIAVGTCTIAASQTGSNAAPQVTLDIIVSKADQAIGAISFLPSTLAVGGANAASATASSGLAVSFSSLTASICTISGSTVTGVAAGVCSIAANQAGDANYNAAPQVVRSIEVVATFTVSTSAGANGSITPAAQTVTQGNTTSFTVTPNVGYTAFASGCGGSLAGNTYTTGAITANCTVSAIFTQGAATHMASLTLGWNLLGNTVNAPLDVAAAFGDTAKVQTVWKWVPTGNTPGVTYPAWAFYAPSLNSTNLATYAASKGYEVLTTINGGEGFWVNAKTAFAALLPAGAAITTSYYQNQLDPAQNKLLKGWNLIAVGDSVTPSAFNAGLSLTPPAQGVTPTNLTTLWTWDSAQKNWYFYAPSLEANGGLVNYITNKNYLDFTAAGKTLGQGVGFWVNRP